MLWIRNVNLINRLSIKINNKVEATPQLTSKILSTPFHTCLIVRQLTCTAASLTDRDKIISWTNVLNLLGKNRRYN